MIIVLNAGTQLSTKIIIKIRKRVTKLIFLTRPWFLKLQTPIPLNTKVSIIDGPERIAQVVG